MSSLYDITDDDQGYHFVNASGDQYNVYIIVYYLLDPDGEEEDFVPIYSIGFNCIRREPNQQHRFDNKTKKTILRIYSDFMGNNPDGAFIYICDNSDDRERARRITFGRWFSEENEGDIYERHISHVTHLDANWYSCLVVALNNPLKDRIVRAYKYTIKITFQRIGDN
ncbi:DUF6169 family protein [Pedobacter metabolipauper]|uniref:Uncharacterized protein n=1 Tax=Pedobacter metabolipauper TaxID=425513 RepID=A0A4R6SQM7_9SPHI|nr:DUF6169 family protein [Pedobacter metabolipauper]TDQ07051.1 hypothetical protein ATK78_4067 [Pedobacter metabolipauper]